MNFFGQSFGDFGSQLKGLLSSPEQQRGLLASPMFNVGMGILANPDNAAQGALAGLASAKEQFQSDEDRKRMEELRKQLSEMIGAQMGQQPPVPGQVPGQPAPTATEQALQMSLNPGLAGSSLNVPGAEVVPMSRTDQIMRQLYLGR